MVYIILNQTSNKNKNIIIIIMIIIIIIITKFNNCKNKLVAES
jgi:hypothetical protein